MLYKPISLQQTKQGSETPEAVLFFPALMATKVLITALGAVETLGVLPLQPSHWKRVHK